MDGTVNILLACETVSHAAQYASYLGTQGFAVQSVYTGADLVEQVRAVRFDLIVIDMDLPGGDALWVLDRLAVIEYAGRVIVVLADAGDPRLALLAGRAEAAFKPLSLKQLAQAAGNGPDGGAVADKTPNETWDETLDKTLPADLAGIQAEAQVQGGAGTPDFGGFIGTSGVMLALYEQIYNAARSTATTFITGESGTGKEVCAQAIHKHSIRAGNAFVPINCAAIPRDLLESEIFGHVRGAFTGAVADRDGAAAMADGGTLFLDEIGEMDPNMQTKLLRFLQDGSFQRVGGNRLERVDVRIICATNRDPRVEMRAGRFREDLFYRLHVVPIAMPPLRARGDDVIDIAQTFLLRYAAEERKRFKGFSGEAEEMLRRYAWPGNIRQLQNVIRHTVVMHDGLAVTGRMLPGEVGEGAEALSAPGLLPSPPLLGDLDGSAAGRMQNQTQGRMRDQGRAHGTFGNKTGQGGSDAIIPLHILERQAIEAAIEACSGNVPRAAALLEVSPSTLYRKKAQWDEERGGRAQASPPSPSSSSPPSSRAPEAPGAAPQRQNRTRPG